MTTDLGRRLAPEEPIERGPGPTLRKWRRRWVRGTERESEDENRVRRAPGDPAVLVHITGGKAGWRGSASKRPLQKNDRLGRGSADGAVAVAVAAQEDSGLWCGLDVDDSVHQRRSNRVAEDVDVVGCPLDPGAVEETDICRPSLRLLENAKVEREDFGLEVWWQ